MDIVYKVFISIFSIIILFVVGFSIVLSCTGEAQVNNYFESVSKVIMESNFNDDVIDMCKEEAADKGHELIVDVYGSGNAGSSKYAEVTLKYKYSIKLFNISLDMTKRKVI